MNQEVSKSQVDRLGDRLRQGNIDEVDLRILDRYRLSFKDAYDFVVGAIRKDLRLEPTGRPAKSTTSIAEKLRRESIRLTQMQDIAGCRLIVSDIMEQERVVGTLVKLFEAVTIVDRRKYPSHGYRAVHLISEIGEKLVEIQIRTALQHLWAELSEKLSDVRDPAIKYGGGGLARPDILDEMSELVAGNETMDLELSELLVQQRSNVAVNPQVAQIRDRLTFQKDRLFQLLRKQIDEVRG